MPIEIYRCTIDVARKDKINPAETIMPPIKEIFLIPNIDIANPVNVPIENKRLLGFRIVLDYRNTSGLSIECPHP